MDNTNYHYNKARIICDSLNDEGVRLTTFEVTCPRYIWAEVMTNRVFSRNAQSSRAIPVKKRLERIHSDPVMPIRWGENKAGMQSKDSNVNDEGLCNLLWRGAAHHMAMIADQLMQEGVHKQWANRLLEPFDTITSIITATNWENMFALRCHPDAQPEYQDLSWKMAHLYYWHAHPESPKPEGMEAPIRCSYLEEGEWHLPLVKNEEIYASLTSIDYGPEYATTGYELAKLSTARCARVSYLNHDGSEPDQAKDIALHDMLLASGHMSPFEHQAMACSGTDKTGNFGAGWMQYRKTLSNEIQRFDYLEALCALKK